jgi:cytochrome c553
MNRAWLLLLLIGAPAQAQDALVARSLAATCANCHGTDGRPRNPTLAPLAGRPADALAAELLAYRSGERAGTVMPQIARGYSEEQLRLVARHFASLPAAPTRP